MKRSEMINDIKLLIEMNLESLEVIPDAGLLAELILYHQEKKGMFPPLPNVRDDFGYYGWEKEDE